MKNKNLSQIVSIELKKKENISILKNICCLSVF